MYDFFVILAVGYFLGPPWCILSKLVLRALDVPVSWTVFCWYATCINQ